jgi:hypothetical protein
VHYHAQLLHLTIFPTGHSIEVNKYSSFLFTILLCESTQFIPSVQGLCLSKLDLGNKKMQDRQGGWRKYGPSGNFLGLPGLDRAIVFLHRPFSTISTTTNNFLKPENFECALCMCPLNCKHWTWWPTSAIPVL